MPTGSKATCLDGLNSGLATRVPGTRHGARGTYVIKVTASDAAANAPVLALQGERESQSFEIDNTPPTVTVTGGGGGTGAAGSVVRFTVEDGHTPIQKVEYASAGDRWRQAFPIDGLLDSREERFELTLEPGARSPVVVRATDSSAPSRPRRCGSPASIAPDAGPSAGTR